jgi:Ribonuclease G/E
VIRELRQGIAKASSEEALITVGPPVRELLLGIRREDLDALEMEFGKRIVVNEGQDWSPERWTIQYR